MPIDIYLRGPTGEEIVFAPDLQELLADLAGFQLSTEALELKVVVVPPDPDGGLPEAVHVLIDKFKASGPKPPGAWIPNEGNIYLRGKGMHPQPEQPVLPPNPQGADIWIARDFFIPFSRETDESLAALDPADEGEMFIRGAWVLAHGIGHRLNLGHSLNGVMRDSVQQDNDQLDPELGELSPVDELSLWHRAAQNPPQIWQDGFDPKDPDLPTEPNFTPANGPRTIQGGVPAEPASPAAIMP